jgi:hypothetical protein
MDNITKEEVGYRSLPNNMRRTTYRSTLSDQVGEPISSERRGSPYGHLVTPQQLEEIEKLLMSFSAPGAKPPRIVEQTLFEMFRRVFENGGDDTLLEVPLKELRDRVNSIEAVSVSGRILNPGSEWSPLTLECSTQEHSQNSNPCFANLPRDAIDDLAQIKEILSPFHPPAFIQNKMQELTMRYNNQTGDLTIFRNALVNYLNTPR